MSKTKEFFDGPEVGLKEMMAAREERSKRQRLLLEKYPNETLLCASMNIPGPVKTTSILNQAFQTEIRKIKDELGSLIMFDELLRLPTGWEYYAVVDLDLKTLKRQMITLEESKPIGRLLDLDILGLENGCVRPISRQALGLPVRRCYVCQNDAKVCGRSRRHSIEEMQTAIMNIIEDN